jgi:predicted peptidase
VTTFRSNGEYYEKTILLVPQCPELYLWVDDVWDAGAYTMKPQPSAPIAAVKQLCEYVIDEYAVDRTRIYAVGVSMGGMAVWDMLARYPSFFAAAAPICGCLDEAQVEAFAKTPIFTANDPRDTIIRSQPTIRVVEKLQSMGADILYKQYDAGIRGDTTYYHASWIDAYSLDTSDNNLYRFIFSRQRQWQAGDMDGDGAITQEDAVYLLLHTMFEDYPLRYGSADVDGNEGVDREDALYLLLRTLFGESFYPI